MGQESSQTSAACRRLRCVVPLSEELKGGLCDRAVASALVFFLRLNVVAP